ncbi:nicotianamine synthase family protein [Methanosarcina sp. WWM596]|uniref:nicotianamine synthase family protein n=1 Tax=Methanosarcina sp. WWM596 TaxID=1434103 RepID=UPI00061554CF|nr:nicotianamine synthase family protein [Methanosarcina sp. WWM596]AKB18245.1 putative methyltransferase [Methanosarcina sp. WWM596]
MVIEINESLELSTETVLGEILALHRDISVMSDDEILYGPLDQSGKLFRQLDYLITMDIENDAALEILQKKELDPVFADLSRFRSLYTVRIETEHANEILESNSPWDALEKFPFYGNYLKLVRTEYEGLRLSPRDRVFFLGSGPLPLTLIIFFRQHGVKSTGIEQDSSRANLSKRVLEKLGLSEAVTIINGNHFSLNGEGFALNLDTGIKALMIAAQAEPKKEILDHLFKVMPVGSRISCRIYEKGLMKLLNRNCLSDLPEGFKELGRVYPEPPVYNTVVFLKKKGKSFSRLCSSQA